MALPVPPSEPHNSLCLRRNYEKAGYPHRHGKGYWTEATHPISQSLPPPLTDSDSRQTGNLETAATSLPDHIPAHHTNNLHSAALHTTPRAQRTFCRLGRSSHQAAFPTPSESPRTVTPAPAHPYLVSLRIPHIPHTGSYVELHCPCPFPIFPQPSRCSDPGTERMPHPTGPATWEEEGAMAR